MQTLAKRMPTFLFQTLKRIPTVFEERNLIKIMLSGTICLQKCQGFGNKTNCVCFVKQFGLERIRCCLFTRIKIPVNQQLNGSLHCIIKIKHRTGVNGIFFLIRCFQTAQRSSARRFVTLLTLQSLYVVTEQETQNVAN